MFDLLATWPWWVFCIFFTIGSAGYGIAGRFADKDIHPSYFAFLYNLICICILGLLVVLYVRQGGVLEYDSKALWGVLVCAISLSIVDVSIVMMYRKGAPVSLGMPLVRIILAILTAGVGVLFFAEQLTFLKTMGILLGCFGIYLAVQKEE